jgi:hypothetical protein
LLSNQVVRDIDQIRRDNMRIIEKECGGPTEAAHKVGMSPAQFSNLRDGAKDSKTGKARGMRKETARRIEAAAGKPMGWLDRPLEEEGAPPESASAAHAVHRKPSLAESLEVLAESCASADANLRSSVAQVLDLMVRNPSIHARLQIPVIVQMLSAGAITTDGDQMKKQAA